MKEKNLIITFNEALAIISNRCKDKKELTKELYRLFPSIIRVTEIKEEQKKIWGTEIK